jgi:vitamin B12 transporter
MPSRFSAPAASLALVFFCSSAIAEELPVFVGDEIVVTPTRSPQRLSDTLAATTVLTNKDIDASGAIDLPGLLQGLTGVEISQTGGFGSQSAVRLRGAEADHTLVLVDGLRMSSVSTGTTAIEHLALDGIERIEIVRGNVSSVYGSEALGGVVHILTRRGRGGVKPRVSAALGTDSFSTVSAALAGELQPGLSLLFSAGHTRSGGFSAVKGQFIPAPFVFSAADVDDDESRNTHFNLRLAQQIHDRLSWGISALQSRAEVEYDGSTANHAAQDLAGYSLYVEGKPGNFVTTRLTIGRSTDELNNDLNGNAADHYHSLLNQLHWENTLLIGQHSLRFGVEAQDQELESNQVYSKTERHAVSAYAGVSMKSGSHHLDASLRHDRYSDFGGHTTGRLAYGYALTPSLRLHGAVGTAYKAPTFNDLYLDFPPFYFSNPNLDPERSKSAEVGFMYSAGGQFLQATLFASRTEDMIAIDPLGFATTVNLDEGRNHGLEVAWNGRVAWLQARASLTLQDPEDGNTGQPLLRRAQRFGSIALSDRMGKVGWHAEMVAAGPHPDVHVTHFTRTTVPGYASLNLAADYALAKGWKLSGHVLNVMNAEYSLVHGYATPGRNLRLELSYSPTSGGI